MSEPIVMYPELNIPQAQFLASQKKYSLFLGGYGSGKTWVGCAGLAQHFWRHPGINAGYFAPTYPQIRDIFYPTVEECFAQWGLIAKVRAGNNEVHAYSGRQLRGIIMCRSMDRPETIIGFKIGHALVDEIDVLPADKAYTAWRKIIARMRYNIPGLRNGVDVTTTPEGFKFAYNQFEKKPREKPELAKLYGIVRASTYDNEINLPDDYIPSLLESYPAQLIEAYINGEFVNLQSGTIYVAFSRQFNSCDDTIKDGEPLFIGMDFNVGKMAAVAHVLRDGQPRAVDELTNGYDTPDMIRRIKERYWRYEGGQYVKTREIRIYPDASGDSRKSVNASQTDIALLREAGFVVCVNAANPPVKDRINAANAMFCNATGERRYKVNVAKCPTYAEALEQQAWAANGEPDKTSGHDHLCFTGDTLVETAAGIMRIDEMPRSGFVKIADGVFAEYTNCGFIKKANTINVLFSDGKTLSCTPEHLVFTGKRWEKAIDIDSLSHYNIDKREVLGIWLKSLQRRSSGSLEKTIICAGSISKEMVNGCTEPFMNTTRGRSPRASMFTMLMATGQIMRLKILNCSKRETTQESICASLKERKIHSALSASLLRRQKNGMVRRPVSSGISNTMRKSKTSCMSKRILFVSAAEKALKQRMLVQINSVRKNATQCTVGGAALTTKQEFASFVEKSLLSENTLRQSVVPESVAEPYVVAIEHSKGPRDVYCLTVPPCGFFRLANGLLVSNCDASGYYIIKEFPVVKKQVRFGF